ncbi:sugar MFS transporter [Neisseria sp. P0009.S001]|jgi:glucose/galactose transporter WARNING|uniref:Glucose/galactose transporter WARNING n=1 Tax=Neisseria subflava NJ9703 TaxID=546268 RepID=A0A9W5IPI4_NEISU|nr:MULTISPECIES: sugar MFS transporter [Neisseria]MDU5726086.1 sugar MFS transporter [Neisseria sp.]EFC51375.1 glucose/galactose transporter WARNING [Neisseria subflava NJ9703]MCL5078965.1 sugar MFS transporter [Neisseria perflava]MDU6148497.1 sugar MFS transporter [Neisseria subflava]OFK03329.1 MFS transporter [Neisseria sp. HMSC067H04]
MSAHSQQNHTPALVVLTTLFFMMGFITCMNDILIPHLKDIFDLTYVQAMLIQFCFFTAYAIMSIPMGYLVGKIGYKNGVISGFVLTAIGCLLFYPAAGSHSYATFLGALFILASGVTLLQVAGNPYVTLLSKPGKESATLTLVQAFNSLGTTIAPQIGAFLILADATQTVSKAEQISSVQIPYLGLAGLLIILAVFVKMIRLPDANKIAEEESEHNHDGKHSVWQYRHLVFGAAGIFCYVGAEVSIGSLLVSVLGYLKGLDHASAAKYLSFYWGGAMVGRFLGSAIMAKIAPNRYLAFNATAAVALLGVAMLAGKASADIAMWALLAIGFFNSIMFPTIFSLATKGLGRFTSSASGVLCTAIVGGAVVPVVQGWAADTYGLMISFVVSAICYVYIVFFAIKGYKADE